MDDALEPSGEHVTIPNDSNVAMLLLAVAWQQKKLVPAQLCPKGAATYQHTSYASLPSQMHSGFVVYVFFPEPTSFVADV